MRPEHRSRDALLQARETGEVDAGDVPFLRREMDRTTNDNRAAMASGALMLSGHVALDDFESQRWISTTGHERSWLYDWWTLGTCAVCWEKSPAARARLRSSAEWARLTTTPAKGIPSTRRITLDTPGAHQERKKDRGRVPRVLSASWGCRYLWNLDISSPNWRPELDVLPRLRVRNLLLQSNPDLQWAGRWLYRVQPELLGRKWPLLPLVPGHQVEYRRYADKTIATWSNRATHLTRGPVSVTMIRDGRLMIFTASEHRKGGEWYQARASEHDEAVRIHGNASSGPVSLDVGLPRQPVVHGFTWTEDGESSCAPQGWPPGCLRVANVPPVGTGDLIG